MFRIRSASDIKHYLYISDTKLDLLYQQLKAPGKTKNGFEWHLNLPGLKLAGKTEREEEDSCEDKLKAVISALEQSGLVGTIDAPKEYFKGNVPMRWGSIRDWGRPATESPLTYFGGQTAATMFGLGGSTRHVIGNAGYASTDARSSAPSIIGEILRGMNEPVDGWKTAFKDADNSNYGTFDAIKWANRNLAWAFEQQLEFYAKTLVSGEFHGDDGEPIFVTLGSPIYVSLEKPARDFSYL